MFQNFFQRLFRKRQCSIRAETAEGPRCAWDEVPSITIVGVTEFVCGQRIINAAARSTTDLLCLSYATPTPAEASMERQIVLSCEFNENNNLVMMQIQFNCCLLVRRTFLVNHAHELEGADGFNDLIAKLNKLGRAGGHESRVVKSRGENNSPGK